MLIWTERNSKTFVGLHRPTIPYPGIKHQSSRWSFRSGPYYFMIRSSSIMRHDHTRSGPWHKDQMQQRNAEMFDEVFDKLDQNGTGYVSSQLFEGQYIVWWWAWFLIEVYFTETIAQFPSSVVTRSYTVAMNVRAKATYKKVISFSQAIQSKKSIPSGCRPPSSSTWSQTGTNDNATWRVRPVDGGDDEKHEWRREINQLGDKHSTKGDCFFSEGVGWAGRNCAGTGTITPEVDQESY